MKVIRLEAISLAGSDINEDLYGYDAQAFWVMDGATALVTPYTGDAAAEVCWLINKVDGIIRSGIKERNAALPEIMRMAALAVRRELAGNENRQPWEFPSCSIALVRVNNDFLEYFLLGDVTLAFKSGEELRVISDDAIRKLDAKAIKEKLRFQAEGLTSAAARQAILPILRRHRSLMNTPGGYWIFNGSPEAIKNALTGTIKLGNSSEFILATDGFSRLVDTFHIYPTWGFLFQDMKKSSLTELAGRLRQLEQDDLECLQYSRFSPHDDATALYVELGHEAERRTSSTSA